MIDCEVYELDEGIVIHCPPVGMHVTKRQAKLIKEKLEKLIPEEYVPYGGGLE